MIKTPEEGFKIYRSKVQAYNNIVAEFASDVGEADPTMIIEVQLQSIRLILAGMAAALNLSVDERREAGEKEV